ncbi:hypothetical protein LPB140_10160 [Sphingorhabdus lutea]|uniref:Uncharacterized protein n=1 Tax=Sphingorhabdus lutea TaxID=1913578 RepID=A0A1L3JD50_9SPHN|nr:tetratricopeptide repeat protein [Sphingorhabdus lutea]APG63087.1 hypothetical protein LPB140_10160 [Sphingorhabdus lutea]
MIKTKHILPTFLSIIFMSQISISYAQSEEDVPIANQEQYSAEPDSEAVPASDFAKRVLHDEVKEAETLDALAILKIAIKECDNGNGQACYDKGQLIQNGVGEVDQEEDNSPSINQDSIAELADEATLQAEIRAAYEAGCRLRHMASCTRLAFRMEKGIGGPRDQDAAYILYNGLCKNGDSWSCTRMGYNLFRSASQKNGAQHDIVLQESALHDDESAESLYARSREFFTLGCEYRNGSACYYLGMMQGDGTGGDQNPSDARKNYSAACKLGYGRGCHALSIAYRTGFGGNANMILALSYMNEACKQGYEPACHSE